MTSLYTRVVIVFHWNAKLMSPWLSSGKGVLVFSRSESSKTDYLRFCLLFILLNLKCWYFSFLAEDSADGYCKQADSNFFNWWVTCLLHRNLTPVHGLCLGMPALSYFTPLPSALYFFRKVCHSETLSCLKQNSCWIRNYAFIQCFCFFPHINYRYDYCKLK